MADGQANPPGTVMGISVGNRKAGNWGEDLSESILTSWVTLLWLSLRLTSEKIKENVFQSADSFFANCLHFSKGFSHLPLSFRPLLFPKNSEPNSLHYIEHVTSSQVYAAHCNQVNPSANQQLTAYRVAGGEKKSNKQFFTPQISINCKRRVPRNKVYFDTKELICHFETIGYFVTHGEGNIVLLTVTASFSELGFVYCWEERGWGSLCFLLL